MGMHFYLSTYVNEYDFGIGKLGNFGIERHFERSAAK